MNRVAATALETMLGSDPHARRTSLRGRVLATGAAIATVAVATQHRRSTAVSALRRGGSMLLDVVERGELLDDLRERVTSAVAAQRDGRHAVVDEDDDVDDWDDDEREEDEPDGQDEEPEEEPSDGDWDDSESQWDEEHEEDPDLHPARRPPRPPARSSRRASGRGQGDR